MTKIRHNILAILLLFCCQFSLGEGNYPDEPAVEDKQQIHRNIWSDSAISPSTQYNFEYPYENSQYQPNSASKDGLFIRQSYNPTTIVKINDSSFKPDNYKAAIQAFSKTQNTSNPISAILMLLAAGTGLLIMIDTGTADSL